LANHLINVEAYAEAEEQLSKALEVNPQHPEAWACRSIIAHLLEDKEAEKAAREKALAHWKDNPMVDYLMSVLI
jgi:Tfp pilus assembly protein PilF